ncbi:MAG: hypothetical protein OXK82_07610 [Deltaproteobacteria bacterium]|nr:hypothetical protein [Deltaproteobacteria bacterium]
MQALKSLYDELVDLYGYQLQMNLSISEWHKLLDGLGKKHATRRDNRVTFGEDDPNDPNATYKFSARYGSMLDANSPNGSNAQLMRCGVIVLAYSLWEDHYRGRIAAECGLQGKNDIESEVFRDLNIYRRAAVHTGRILRDRPKVLPFLSKGAALRFSPADMQRLFELLIDELNRLGRDYYHTNTSFSLSRTLNI